MIFRGIHVNITTKNLAELCNVSRGTVDRALNDRPGISPQTKQFIKDTAQRLGYKPDLLARSMVKGKTMSIGIVVFDLYNGFFAQLVNALELKARNAGYFILITLTDKDKDIEKQCIENLVSRKVDGIILVTVQKEKVEEERLKALNIPVVLTGNKLGDLSFIGINDKLAMQDMTKLVTDKDYKKVLYVSPPLRYINKSNIYAQQQRLLGFEEVMNERGLKNYRIITDDYIHEIEKELKLSVEKIVIVCSNDIYALEINKYFSQKGLMAPEDFGLTGFDNLDMLEYITPRISTVDYPIEELANALLGELLNRINGQNTDDCKQINHIIIQGESL